MDRIFKTEAFKNFSSARVSLMISESNEISEREKIISEMFSEIKSNLTLDNIKLLNVLDDMLTCYTEFVKVEAYIQGFKDRSLM